MDKLLLDRFSRFCLVVILFLCLLGLALVDHASAARVCDPFTKDPDPGMLPIGTQVQFNYFTASGLQTLTGKVDAYYIQSCFPGGGSIIGLDPQAYIIEYGAADHSRTIQNLRQLTVMSTTSGDSYVHKN